MARRYEIDDAQWEKIKPFLGNTPKKNGRPQADNSKLLNVVLWIMHTGAPWRDLPEYYGSWENREYIANHDADFCMPPKSNSVDPWHTDFYHFKEMHLVECFFMKIKDHCRIAMRFEKLACRFLAFIHLAATLLWLA